MNGIMLMSGYIIWTSLMGSRENGQIGGESVSIVWTSDELEAYSQIVWTSEKERKNVPRRKIQN